MRIKLRNCRTCLLAKPIDRFHDEVMCIGCYKNATEFKKCSRCGEEKILTDFWKVLSETKGAIGAAGRMEQCKECTHEMEEKDDFGIPDYIGAKFKPGDKVYMFDSKWNALHFEVVHIIPPGINPRDYIHKRRYNFKQYLNNTVDFIRYVIKEKNKNSYRCVGEDMLTRIGEPHRLLDNGYEKVEREKKKKRVEQLRARNRLKMYNAKNKKG